MAIFNDVSKRSMAFSIKAKFDKYWGDPTKMNLLIFITNVLDPRYKLEYMEFSLNEIYGDSVGRSLFNNVKSGLQELFDDYSASINPPPQASSQSGILSDASEATFAETGNSMSLLKARFKKHKMNLGFGGSKNTDLDIYLSETVIENDGPFDILRW